MKILLPEQYRVYWESCPTFLPLRSFTPFEARAQATYGASIQHLADRGGMNLIEAYLLLHDLPLTEYEYVDPDAAVEYLKETAERDWKIETEQREAEIHIAHKSSTCDFCGSHEVWTSYQVDTFVVAGVETPNATWDACKACSELIDSEKWDDLLDHAERCMRERIGDLPGLRHRLKAMHDQVRNRLHRVA